MAKKNNGNKASEPPNHHARSGSGRKSRNRQNFHSAAGKARSLSSPEFGAKGAGDYSIHFGDRKNALPPYQNGPVKYQTQYYNYKQEPQYESIPFPQDRHYSFFQNPDTHTEEEHNHDEAFIKLQMAAAGGVTYTAAAGGMASIFNPTEALLLGATGAGNVARNKGWWSAINNIPKNLGRIATAPSYTYAKILHNTAEALDSGVYESQKRIVKSWATAKSKTIDKDNKIKRAAIESLAKDSDGEESSIRQALTKLRINTKLAGHYINNSPSYLIGSAAGYIGNSLQKDKSAKGVFHKETLGMRKWMKQKSKSIHADNKVKRKAIESFAKNPIGKDIIVTKISAAFLGLGAAVHIPQTYMGWDMYQQSGDLNGHLLGAGGVAASYGLIAMHKLREIPRLKEAKEIFKAITNETWDNSMRHDTIGHMARKEYAQQALFVGLPLVGIMGKGLAYMYESTHLHHWDTETFTGIPEKLSHFDPKGALDYLKSTDTMTMIDSLTKLDYTDALTMSASAAMLVSGAVFFKSGWDETLEDFGRLTTYASRKYIKNPINVAFYDMGRTVEDNIDEASSERIKDLWYLNVKPTVGSMLPDWLVQEPYDRIKTAQAREVALVQMSPNKCIYIHPDDYLKGDLKPITQEFTKSQEASPDTHIKHEVEFPNQDEKSIHLEADAQEKPSFTPDEPL